MSKMISFYIWLKQTIMKSTVTTIFFLGALLFSLSSCALLYVGAAAVSSKVKDNKFSPEKVSEIKVDFSSPLTFSDLKRINLTLVVTDEKKGEITFPVGKDELATYEDFEITVSGANHQGDGLIATPANLDELTSNLVTIKVVYKPKPTVIANYSVDLFSKVPAIHVSGKNGMTGHSGYSGKNAQNASANYACKDGEDGQHGDHGNRGGDGQEVIVYMKQIDNNKLGKPLIAVKYSTPDETKYTFFDPSVQNTINIFSLGGNGGDGGSGGRGGDGTTGPVTGCRGGKGGDGGDGGDGGNGGIVTLNVDPNVDLSKINIVVNVEGGEGGDGGSGGIGGRVSGDTSSYAKGKQGREGRSGFRGDYSQHILEISDAVFNP